MELGEILTKKEREREREGGREKRIDVIENLGTCDRLIRRTLTKYVPQNCLVSTVKNSLVAVVFS
jgi:hypothetical protein